MLVGIWSCISTSGIDKLGAADDLNREVDVCLVGNVDGSEEGSIDGNVLGRVVSHNSVELWLGMGLGSGEGSSNDALGF
jgi:hypothetical protein